ncbi:hypothetical protein C8R45DRAFT_1082443 [Mycena sanguinolenta]|nr:hypothetical protein C8R45DRAFT_1082443 [Mycena sanguinolenta]
MPGAILEKVADTRSLSFRFLPAYNDYRPSNSSMMRRKILPSQWPRTPNFQRRAEHASVQIRSTPRQVASAIAHSQHPPRTKASAELNSGDDGSFALFFVYFAGIFSFRDPSLDKDDFPATQNLWRCIPEESTEAPSIRSLMTHQLLVPLGCFAALTFTETSYSVLIPLMFSTSIENGGLGFSSLQIGTIMGILFIAMNVIARAYGEVNSVVWALVVVQFLFCNSMSLQVRDMFIVDSAPNKAALTMTNELGQVAASKFDLYTAFPPFSMRTVVLEQRERTNGSSKAEIERLIEESESKLIISPESQISTPIELRDRDRAYVVALRSLISPVTKLPVELLAEIFHLTIRDDDRHVWDALGISQVCSYWRQIAHSTPRLWTGPMEVYLRQGRGSDGEQVYVDGLKTWLQRSAPLSVPITLLLGSGYYKNSNNRIPDGILSTAPRWRSLRLDVPDTTPLSFVRQLSEGQFDSLEELDLEPDYFTGFRPTTSISFIVPRLRKLRMNLWSNMLPIDILLPWAQLTVLTLSSDFPNITLDILAQCTSLVQATVTTTVPTRHSRSGTPARSEFGEGKHFVPFLECMAAPVLQELCLNFGGMVAGVRAPWSEAHFTAFELRASNITQLELLYSYPASNDLLTAMRHAPSLTHLTLICCKECADDTLLDALRYKADGIPLVPHLHNLHLDRIGEKFTKNCLAGMIASRWWTDAELVSRAVPPAVSRWTRVQLWSGLGCQLFTSSFCRRQLFYFPPNAWLLGRLSSPIKSSVAMNYHSKLKTGIVTENRPLAVE